MQLCSMKSPFEITFLWFTGITAIYITSITPTNAEESLDKCPEDFVLVPYVGKNENHRFQSTCYFFSEETSTFEEAAEKCLEMNSTLATPKLESEAKSLAHYVIDNIKKISRYWIGLSDQEEEGVFKWEDSNTELKANLSWLSGEPESNINVEDGTRGHIQDCVKMAIWIFGREKSAHFYDTYCQKEEYFICEHEMKTMSSFVSIETTKPQAPEISPNEYTKEDLETESITQVAFMAPENSTYFHENISDTVKKLKNVSTEDRGGKESSENKNEMTFPMELIAYGGEESEKNEDLMIKLNSTLTGPEVSYHPLNSEKNLPKPEVICRNCGNSSQVPKKTRSKKRSCVLTCDPGYMRAACPLRYFPQIKYTKIVLNNQSCRPRKNRTHLIVHITLDECGTKVQNSEKDNKVSFRNTIRLVPKGSGIVRNLKEAASMTEFMMLDCRYPQHHSVMQNYQPAGGHPEVHKTTEYGPPLDHEMLLYKTEKYECPFAREDYPVKIPLSQRIYLEVTLDMPTKRVEIHPLTCFATPDSNPYNSNNYVIMQDGCVEDNTFRFEESDSKKVSRFSIESFRFIGYFRKVFIHCNYIVCKLNSKSSSSCPYACEPDSRYRREVLEDELDDEEKRFTTRSGMITFTNENEETVEQSAESMKEKENEGGKGTHIIGDEKKKQELKPAGLYSNQGQEEKGNPENSGPEAKASPFILLPSILVALHCLPGF